MTLDQIQQRENAYLQTLATSPYLRLINPEVATQPSAASSAASGAKQPGTTARPTSGDPTVKDVQLALQKQTCTGCYPGPADGVAGKDTTDAVSAYQTFKKLPVVNGNPKDPATLQSLGVRAPTPPAPGKGA